MKPELSGEWYKINNRGPDDTLWWIAVHDKKSDYLWVYVPQIKSMVEMPSLTEDFVYREECRYTPINKDEATAEIQSFNRSIDREWLEEIPAKSRIPINKVLTVV